MAHIGISDKVPKTVEDNHKFFVNNFTKLNTIIDNYPIAVNFGLTSHCNMKPRCVMCLTSDDIVMESFLLDKFDPLFENSLSIRFTSMGEPTMFPNFLNLVKRINGWVCLQTNGIKLLDSQELIANLHDLYVSVDAATDKTYRKIRGVHYDRVIAGIKKAVDIRDTINNLLFIRIDFVLMKSNIDEVLDFIDMGKDLGVNGIYVSSLFPLDIYPNIIQRDDFIFDYKNEIVDYKDKYVKDILAMAKYKCDLYKIAFTGVAYA
jgi:MoaA/NifB/PqqE/SkfB family radical SAM enzyme